MNIKTKSLTYPSRKKPLPQPLSYEATVYTHLWVRCEMLLDPPKSPLKGGL